MKVSLKDLQPNPFRDFTIDPIDKENVKVIAASIGRDGFWGGVTARRYKGQLEIAAGHHRVDAAIASGETTADIFIGDFDDAAMIRVYATENATQRGNTGTALAGSVASAIRFISKDLLTGGNLTRILVRSTHAVETLQGQLLTDRGLGNSVITQFLGGVPGINESTVTQQLANLKASGDYARIIREVQEELEIENRERLKELAAQERELKKLQKEREEAEARQQAAEEARKIAAANARAAKEAADIKRAAEAEQKAKNAQKERELEARDAARREQEQQKELDKFDALRTTRDAAEKAASTAEQRTKTFDFEGVAKHMKNPHQIDVFREQVTKLDTLPVNQQARIAKHLVDYAAELSKKSGRHVEVSGSFIREHIASLVLQQQTAQRRITREEAQQLKDKSWEAKFREAQDDFARALLTVVKAGRTIHELLKIRPKTATVTIIRGIKDSIPLALKTLTTLRERL